MNQSSSLYSMAFVYHTCLTEQVLCVHLRARRCNWSAVSLCLFLSLSLTRCVHAGLYLGEEEVPWSGLTASQMVVIVVGCGMMGFVGQTLLNSSFQRESAVRFLNYSFCCASCMEGLSVCTVLGDPGPGCDDAIRRNSLC